MLKAGKSNRLRRFLRQLALHGLSLRDPEGEESGRYVKEIYLLGSLYSYAQYPWFAVGKAKTLVFVDYSTRMLLSFFVSV